MTVKIDKPTSLRRIVVAVTDAEHAEFNRLSAVRHNRTVGKQAQTVLREWIASEQAAESEEASAA